MRRVETGVETKVNVIFSPLGWERLWRECPKAGTSGHPRWISREVTECPSCTGRAQERVGRRRRRLDEVGARRLREAARRGNPWNAPISQDSARALRRSQARKKGAA